MCKQPERRSLLKPLAPQGPDGFPHNFFRNGTELFQNGELRLAHAYFKRVLFWSHALDSGTVDRVHDILKLIKSFVQLNSDVQRAQEVTEKLARELTHPITQLTKTQYLIARRAIIDTENAVKAADEAVIEARREALAAMSGALHTERDSFSDAVQLYNHKANTAREYAEQGKAIPVAAAQRARRLLALRRTVKFMSVCIGGGVDACRHKQYDIAIKCLEKAQNPRSGLDGNDDATIAHLVTVAGLARDAVIAISEAQSTRTKLRNSASQLSALKDDDYRRSTSSLIASMNECVRLGHDAVSQTHKAVEGAIDGTGSVDEKYVNAVIRAHQKVMSALEGVRVTHLKFEEAQRRAVDRAERRKQQALAKLDERFETDFLSADNAFKTTHDNKYVTMDSYRLRKIGFVKLWAKRAIDVELDDDQATAIAAVHGNVQVIARAGSGKTRTLVTRAAFLVRHCGVSPRALLLLAFNKKAAAEMKERLERWLRAKEVPHVMTFHALGYAIVQPQEELIYDDLSRKALYLSRELQGIIDNYCRQGNWLETIIEYLLSLFRGPFDRSLKPDEVSRIVQERRGFQLETIRGDYVKSNAERLIANALFEYDVDYKYEKGITWNGSVYRPDFTIEQPQHVVIEYFGIRGSDSYDEMSNAKREFWAQKRDCRFLEYSPADIESKGVEGFVERLLDDLRRMGIETRRLSDAEIWQKVGEKQRIDRYSETMTNFVNRCRASNLEADDLDRLVMRHAPNTKAERLFLKMARTVYREYLRKLRRESKEDFSGLMWRAGEIVRNGRSTFTRDRGRECGDVAKLKFILIDEFQDYSSLFHNLLEAIRFVNAGVEVFAVGDDWQAINGFAGSELTCFAQFEAHIGGNVNRCELTTNFRSSTSVVEAGNRLMKGRGTPGRSAAEATGGVYVAKLEKFEIAPLERLCHDDRRYASAVVRLIRRLMRGARYGTPVRNVVMLSRTGTEPERHTALERFFGGVRRLLTTEERNRITVSTCGGVR